MCSINGFNFIDKDLIQSFLINSHHRGPDLSKTIFRKNLSLGFNLLAINSTAETGIQPLESDNYIMMFNGEIYNKKYLHEKFNLIHNQSDTTLLFELINKINLKICDFIEGIYSIFIYDKKNNTIFLLRDNFGSKPLYYSQKGNKFYFSSFFKNLVKIRKSTIDKSSIENYLSYGYNFGQNTFFKDIKSVPTNKILKFDLKNNTLHFEDKYNKRSDQGKLDFEKTIIQSFDVLTKDQGLLLSGGVDSNIIFELLNKYNYKPEIFSTRFDNAEREYNDDFFKAKNSTKKYNLNFNEIKISKKNIIENYESSYSILDQPILNINMPVYYETFKQIKNYDIRTLICGDGGDEIFFGYNWHYLYFLLSLKKINILTSKISKKFLLKFIWYEINSNFENKFDIFNNLNFFKPKNLTYLKNEIYNYKNKGFNFLHTNMFFKMTNDFLMFKDNIGMHFSIESRYPFLQNEILNFFKDYDLKSFFQKDINKPILYKYFNNILNKQKFLKTNKKGWSIPRNWLNDDTLVNNIKNKIKSRRSQDFLKEFNIQIKNNLLDKNIKYRTLIYSLIVWQEKNL